MERSPYRPAPTTPHEAPDNTWDTDVFDHLLSAGNPDVVNITVEGAPLDLLGQRDSTSLSAEHYHDMPTIHYSHDERYSMPSTPARRYEHEYRNTTPGRLPGLQLSNSYSSTIRSNSFTGGYAIPSSHLRTHSDTTQSRSRPRFNLQSRQLMGSAVEDAFSPVALSIPSSPTHSGHDPHSPVPPWSGAQFLAPPAQTFGPHVQSFHDSDTSSNQSSSPNLDFSAVSFDFEGALSEPQDNTLHPPMLLPRVWDPNYLAPGSMMYRNADTSSLFSSDDGSSVGPPSPITDWDLVSTSGDYVEDTGVNAQDDNSPKTNSSNETERPASRLDKDFTEKLQLQDRPSTSTSTSVYSFETSTDDLPDHVDAQRLTGIATAGSDLFGFGTHGPLARSDEEGRFRSVVSTEAGRRASDARRKGPARFFCEHCGATFTAKHNLRNHLKSHTLTKDCICETCGRGFGTKHVLRRHERKCNARRRPSGSSSEAAE